MFPLYTVAINDYEARISEGEKLLEELEKMV